MNQKIIRDEKGLFVKEEIHLPGEEVSSEEDYDVPKERRQNISTNISYPVPPTTAPKPLSQKNADCNNSNYQNLDPPRLMNQDPFPTQPRYTNIGEPANSYAISGESSSEITYDKDLDVHCNSSSVNLPVAIQSKSQRFSNGYANSAYRRKTPDNIVALLHSTNEVPTQPQPQHNSNNELIALLPINEAGFDHLNTTLADSSSFKQKLTKILLSVGGKDVKAFIANILRKLISDDLAQLYSLTGKLVKNGGAKKSFEKTETFRFIYDISIKAHKDAKESVIKEGISDWLMQAKFEKSKVMIFV
ncbi:hypothetical protein RN001_002553 [Aquatica leii]|uniref:DUF4806 domain-containing protein n=1 Tax=Aquatica leii TaxID=1421715 RepID=A0AAN7Q8R1_9COLE|nr:hypothetical protein RN001_002553 [Aquatica leii]